MYAPSYRNAVWLIAQDAMPQIGVLSISVGTGGAPVYIADIKNPLGASLLGRPIIWSPHCQTLGTTGDIILADLGQYITITKAGIGMETAASIHVKFIYDETAFRFVVRFDGQPWWASARTPKHGSSTVSPFVALASKRVRA
jgi:HK97 family phage major capsid protein